ncbi:helix-turn-helix transcriptional regulator [Actinacidiphila sp. bgisy160]|uniref:helix-turn-helix transcriptional regulator n=1 Tax=Actinacidiphila sp. bgisy160 TaxID=3413796 RepID=UPI003D71ADFB
MRRQPEEEVALLTVPQIAERRGWSRQGVHDRIANDPDFPEAVLVPGSTRPRWPADAVDRYFDTHPKAQGKGGGPKPRRNQGPT